VVTVLRHFHDDFSYANRDLTEAHRVGAAAVKGHKSRAQDTCLVITTSNEVEEKDRNIFMGTV
jgi:nickel-dependent lactate racemase